MTQRLALGIDVGATKIRGVVFDGKKVLRRHEYKYPPSAGRSKPTARRSPRRPKTAKEFWQALFGVIDILLSGLPRKKLAGIGLGFPAAIENGRRAWRPENLLVIEGMDILTPPWKRYRTKIVITNDVKTATLAEWALGAGKGAKSVFMLTLGTGVGGGFVKDGKIQSGAFDTAFEVGHMIIDATISIRVKQAIDFETMTSEKFFLRKGINPLDAEKRARRGNKQIQKLWQLYGVYLGIGLANIVYLIEPEVIVVGGGMSRAWPLFAPTMKKTMQYFLKTMPSAKKIKIKKAKLGRDAGAIGAALLVAPL